MILEEKKTHTHQNLLINAEVIESVNEYKYLGTVIDSRLTWDGNTSAIYKKGQQRLHFMRKLRQYKVDSSIMKIFYQSFIESALTFCLIAWYGALSLDNRGKLRKIVNISSRIAGIQFSCLTHIYETRVLKKGKAIACDPSHPLSDQYQLLRSGRRYCTLSLDTRAKKTFVPTSIALLNKHISPLCECTHGLILKGNFGF